MNKLSISVTLAEKSLRTIMPLVEASLEAVSKNGGRTHLPKGALTSRLKTAGVENWAEIYLDPAKAVCISLLGIYSPTQLEEIVRNLYTAGAPAQRQFWLDLLEWCSTEHWYEKLADEWIDSKSPDELVEEIQAVFDFKGETYKLEVLTSVKASLLGLVVSYYDAFAMMVYGAPMSALIDDARRGDIQSYFKAYHVDQTVADIPIFATLHERKKQEADGKFFTAISRRNRTALIPPKLKYPKLWFAFGYLDGLGVLPSREGAGFSLEQLLDLCVSLKIYGASYDRGVEDLSKRLQDYRSLQKRLKARKFNT